jgi:hypothetical protein
MMELEFMLARGRLGEANGVEGCRLSILEVTCKRDESEAAEEEEERREGRRISSVWSQCFF